MSECVDPLELDEGELMAYVDGQESEKVRTHLARCPYCVAQVAAYRHTEVLLRAVLHRVSCPTPERLGLYQLNLLPTREQLIVARHVRECPHCARELEELARVGSRPSLLERLHRAVDVVEAVLLPAPRLQVAPLRGTIPALQRFRAERLDVHISVQPGHAQGARTVMGRLVPHDEITPPIPGIEVWLIRDDRAWAAAVEASGVFSFEEVAPGEYAVGLEWDGQAVLMEGIKVE